MNREAMLVTGADGAPAEARSGLLFPLRVPLFRRIWLASLLSNLGYMFLSVGAAWQMIQLTPRSDMVALVMTALMLPMTLLSIPAGAFADMYDQRKVALASLMLSMTSASLLTILTILGLITPWLLLGFCFLIGTGMTTFNPAWQASVSEQVPRDKLAPAIALNSISFNIARSFGPAIGGVIVALAGATAAFGGTAIGFVPMFVVFLLWRRKQTPFRLPPERIDRAVSAGIRYVFYSPAIRTMLLRILAVGLAGSALSAMMPLVARDLLGGSAEVFGLILGSYGFGAVIGALALERLRSRLSEEALVALASVVMVVSIVGVALSRSVPLTCLVLVVGGAGWMMAMTLFNVLIQLSAPRWVSGRLLAAFQTAIAGGIAIGSWFWGHIAQVSDMQTALLFSAVAMAATLPLGFVLRMPSVPELDLEPVKLKDPEVQLDLNGRSGPIVVELEYRIEAGSAREFYDRMLALRSVRNRNGAFSWSLSRDINDPERWIERFHCPTWHDYLRQRDRNTPEEMGVHENALSLLKPGHELNVRRFLERPFGSVRWKEDVPTG